MTSRDRRVPGRTADPALVAALSGSNNIVTMSNPVIAMIAGPAGYTTTKLLRVGLPLVLAYIALMVVAVNLLY